MAQKARLVAFDKENEISPAFLHHGAGGFGLSVQGIHQRDGSIQFQAVQQGLPGGNLMALVSHGFDRQGAPALDIDRADQLSALAATQRFAVQDHDAAVLASMTGLLPGPDGLLEWQDRNGFEHSVNAIFRRHLVALGFAVEPAARGRSLRWTQVPREGGHGAMAALAAAQANRQR